MDCDDLCVRTFCCVAILVYVSIMFCSIQYVPMPLGSRLSINNQLT